MFIFSLMLHFRQHNNTFFFSSRNSYEKRHIPIFTDKIVNNKTAFIWKKGRNRHEEKKIKIIILFRKRWQFCT